MRRRWVMRNKRATSCNLRKGPPLIAIREIIEKGDRLLLLNQKPPLIAQRWGDLRWFKGYHGAQPLLFSTDQRIKWTFLGSKIPCLAFANRQCGYTLLVVSLANLILILYFLDVKFSGPKYLKFPAILHLQQCPDYWTPKIIKNQDPAVGVK